MSARDALPVVTDADTRTALLDAVQMFTDRADELRTQANAVRAYRPDIAADLVMCAQHRERQAALLRAEFERRVSEAACAWRDAA